MSSKCNALFPCNFDWKIHLWYRFGDLGSFLRSEGYFKVKWFIIWARILSYIGVILAGYVGKKRKKLKVNKSDNEKTKKGEVKAQNSDRKALMVMR